MALKPAMKPVFEDMPEGDEPDTAQVETPSPANAAEQPAKASAVAVRPKKIKLSDWDLLASLKDRLPPVDFGEGVRLVGSNGQIMDGDKKLLGDWVELMILSWNDRWVISPGVQGDEAKKLARYSFDGEVTSKGENVEEYVQQLKEDGYEKATSKGYLDLFGILLGSGKPNEHIGKSVTLSMSPDSVKAFNGFRRDLVVMGMTGRLPEGLAGGDGLEVRITTEIKSGNGNTWTRLTTALKP